MGILSRKAKRHIKRAFKEADADDSGTLDAGELQSIMAKVAEEEGVEPPTQEEIEERLKSAPTETEGKVTLKELMIMFSFLKVMAIVAVLFKEADADESGELEPAEIKGVVSKMCEQTGEEVPPDEELDKFIADLGGKVTFEQFAEAVVPLVLAHFGVSPDVLDVDDVEEE